MARYSNQRELNKETRYISKVLRQVDERIELPPTLTGDALLPLLDAPPEKRQAAPKPRFSPRVFTWKSGVTYAAAFVLIVALSALLGRGSPTVPDDVVSGGFEPVSGDTGDATPETQDGPIVQYNPEAAPEGNTATPRSNQPDTAGEGAVQSPVTAEGNVDTEGGMDAYGGPGPSVHLTDGEFYTYTYRTNDPTDPDKDGYPITVSVMHTNTGVLAYSIDIDGMNDITGCFLYENTATFVGASSSGGVATRTFDMTNVGNARETRRLTQPGTLLDARLYKNVVNVFTYAPAGTSPGCQVIEVADSLDTGMCIVSAVDVDANQTSQLAVSGVSDDLSLYNLNAYLQYEGEPTEENEQGVYMAHIRLDGANIEYRGNQDPEEE